MIWDGNRNHRIVYRAVSWPGFEEGMEYRMFTEGGSLDLSSSTSLKASGTIPFAGAFPPFGQMVRVIYSISGIEIPMATLFMDVSEPVYGAGSVTGSAVLTSVLSVLAERKFGQNHTVRAGSQAVSAAVSLAEDCGLIVNNPDPSAYTLTEDHVFKPSDSYLTAVDWLLEAAGYMPCFPDAYGVVQMVPRIDPSACTPAWTFSDGERSIMLPEVRRRKADAVPNMAKVWFSNDKESLWSSCENADPSSPDSTATRKREVTATKDVSELEGDTQSKRIAEMKRMAKELLIDGMSPTETVEFTHAWVPVFPNDAVAVRYERHSLAWQGGIESMNIQLSGAVLCTTTATKAVPVSAKLTVKGGAL